MGVAGCTLSILQKHMTEFDEIYMYSFKRRGFVCSFEADNCARFK